MSLLPSLAIPIATGTLPSAGALVASKPPSSTALQSTDANQKAALSTDKLDSNYTNDEQGQVSFWDTLQQQAASSDPSLGQQISALANDEELVPDENPTTDIKTDILADGQVYIEITNQQTVLIEMPVVAPWSMAAMQRSMSQVTDSEVISNNPAMDQIESQRILQLQVQTDQAGILNPYAPRLEDQTAALLMTETTVPLMQSEMAKATQPALGQFALTSGKEALSANGLTEEVGLSNGLKLDESLSSKESINIHEKPITLVPQETMAAPVNTQSTPLADAALSQMPDALDGIEGLAQQTAKEIQSAASRLESPANSVADKVLAGQAKIDVPPSSPKFTEQIAQRIGIMNTEKLQTARIQLDPPELGSLEIKIKVQQDQVSVSFSSGHPTVRDALEAQSPRLREMLEQQGVELTDVSVSDQQHQAAGEGNPDESNDEDSGDWAEDETMEETVINTVRSDSLVDDFV
jgi:flagellar hook-length control protein FliK